MVTDLSHCQNRMASIKDEAKTSKEIRTDFSHYSLAIGKRAHWELNSPLICPESTGGVLQRKGKEERREIHRDSGESEK